MTFMNKNPLIDPSNRVSLFANSLMKSPKRRSIKKLNKNSEESDQSPTENFQKPSSIIGTFTEIL